MLPSPLDRLPGSAISRSVVEADGIVFRQEAPTRGLFHVKSGAVELHRHTQAGARVTLHRALAGDTFAEASLFSDTYHCDAVAGCRTELLCVDRDAVMSLFAADAEFAFALAKRFAVQIQSCRRRMEIMAISSAEDRVQAALGDGILTGSVLSFAAEIGLAHETTYRALASLVRKGRAVRLGRGRYRSV